MYGLGYIVLNEWSGKPEKGFSTISFISHAILDFKCLPF